MGLTCSQPKAEGLIRFYLGKEIIKIGSIIGITHCLEEWLKLSLTEFLTCGIGNAPSRRKTPGTPCFSSKPDRIAGLRQDIRISNELLRQSTPKVARLFQSPDRLTGKEGTAGRPASRGVTKGMGKTDSLPRHTVEGGSLDYRITIGPGVSIGLIVGYTEENIRTLIRA